MSKRREVKEEVTPVKEGPTLLKITIVPETWILAPSMPKDQLQRWRECGWIDEDGLHLDRAFPRNSQGLPVIFRKWLRAPMVRACQELAKSEGVELDKCRELVNTFSIVGDDGVATEYVVIPKQPLRYRRYVAPGKSEYFEYIDSTTQMTFNVVCKDPKLFLKVLSIAGRVGLMARTKYGYGKFSVKVEIRNTV